MATIIDADGHLLEPPSVWQEYTEPAYRAQVIQIAKDAEGVDCLKINGELRRDRNMAIAAACTPGGMSDAQRARTMSWDEIVPGGYDPHQRLKDMDLEGIEIAFFYPTLWLIYGDITDPQVAAAACRAYNNWLADFCLAYPQRFYGVAPLPLQNVEAAVTEMRRVVTELGMRAVFIRPNPFKRPSAQRPGLSSPLAGSPGTQRSGCHSWQFPAPGCRPWARSAIRTRSFFIWCVIPGNSRAPVWTLFAVACSPGFPASRSPFWSPESVGWAIGWTAWTAILTPWAIMSRGSKSDPANTFASSALSPWTRTRVR